MLVSLSEIKTLEPEQIKVSELSLTGCDVLTILPTGYGSERVEFIIFFGKAFCLEHECAHVSDFTAYKH